MSYGSNDEHLKWIRNAPWAERWIRINSKCVRVCICLCISSEWVSAWMLKHDEHMYSHQNRSKLNQSLQPTWIHRSYTSITIKVFLLAMPTPTGRMHYCHESNVTRLLKLTFKSNEQLIFDAKLCLMVTWKARIYRVCHVSVCVRRSTGMVSPESNLMVLILQYCGSSQFMTSTWSYTNKLQCHILLMPKLLQWFLGSFSSLSVLAVGRRTDKKDHL